MTMEVPPVTGPLEGVIDAMVGADPGSNSMIGFFVILLLVTLPLGLALYQRDQKAQSKIPILGDIPLLGMLFKHKITANGKTELMIFMTPHIVKRPRDLAGITSGERGKAQVLPKAFTEQDLNRYLDNLPAPDNAKPKK